MNDFILSAFADEAAESLTGQIDAMQENNISMLEIRGVDGENISVISAEKAKKIRRTLDDSNIKVWATGSPTGKINITDDFTPHKEQFKHMLELSQILGAQRYRMFSFFCQNRAAERDIVMERLAILAETAKGSGIVLCHENEKDIYGEKVEECLDIHKSIPEIKAVFDPANFVQSQQEVIPAWEMLEPYIEYIHVKDAKDDGTVVPAGFGEGQLPEVIKRYKKIGGKVLTIEPHLSVFSGFSELEKDNKNVKKFEYPSQRAAFDAAVNALLAVSDNIE